MKINAVYEKGVFRPSEKVNLPEHQKLVLHFWPEIKSDQDLEKTYAEASTSRPDLDDWETVDIEGWK
ncbi:MAG: antitoxin family protein [Candidatus Scalinduaceae bacterium]